MVFEPEGWNESMKILVILAHPDDPEFFFGATLARWSQQGHEIRYCLLTKGQKGAPDLSRCADELTALRVVEQKAAAASLGVCSVEFLDYVDGEVVPDLAMQKKIVRVIRRWQPQILVTSDPLNLFPTDTRINHPDHRAAGQAVVDAAFPAVGNPMFFPELIKDEGLQPHSVDEIWLSATAQPNLQMDVTEQFETKLAAIHCHRSQISIPFEQFDAMMRQRLVMDSETGKEVFKEQFKRLKLV
ncbi:N-acetyl-alpha-D-glucosaminyl L-malate deacetylase 1 [bioreactor metagenome]|uniref:N-acetyl-alpha-D-glucosaminyl L-malate deacetylase 1 n=1 Tax=bioreactor metagenome TaxID=1076179 RepID=A0A645G2G0_9ZZZZ